MTGQPLVQGHTGYVPDPEGPEFKGSVIIQWPAAARKTEGAGRLLPGCLTSVYDEETGQIIPAASVTVRVGATGFVTADIAVFLDKNGEIVRNAGQIWLESDGVPATFPFLVAEMRSSAAPAA
jgi:hypothetical protein